MTRPSLQNVLTSNSFQVWLDRTNDMVSILNTNAMTASNVGSGDTTVGSATLVGDFTANNVVATVGISSDLFISKTPSANIVYNSPISVETTSQNTATFKNSSGARTVYSSNTVNWTLGFVDTATNNFMINSGIGSPKFTFLSTGEMKLKDLTATSNVSASYLFGDGSGITNLSANNIVGTLSNITGIDASKINTGTLINGVIPNNIVRTSRTITPALGGGLAGGGNLASDVTMSVDATVVRTSGSQSIAGIKTFTNNMIVNADITASGNITAFSDARLKTNVSTIENALDKVLQLRGVYYETLDTSRPSIGVIAQEVEKVLPEVVLQGEYKSVAYGNIVGVLIEAIKELKAEVNALKTTKI